MVEFHLDGIYLQSYSNTLFSSMLIFSGKGVVVPLVWMATAAVNGLVFNLKGADNAVVTLMISGTICTVLGRRWHRQRLEWEE